MKKNIISENEIARIRNAAQNKGATIIGRTCRNIRNSFIKAIEYIQRNAKEIATKMIEKIKAFMYKWNWTKWIYDKVSDGIMWLTKAGKAFFKFLYDRLVDGLKILQTAALWAAYHAGKATLLFLGGLAGTDNEIYLNLYSLIQYIENLAEDGQIITQEQVEEGIMNTLREEDVQYVAA